jgi:hypothetical protein
LVSTRARARQRPANATGGGTAATWPWTWPWVIPSGLTGSRVQLQSDVGDLPGTHESLDDIIDSIVRKPELARETPGDQAVTLVELATGDLALLFIVAALRERLDEHVQSDDRVPRSRSVGLWSAKGTAEPCAALRCMAQLTRKLCKEPLRLSKPSRFNGPQSRSSMPPGR